MNGRQVPLASRASTFVGSIVGSSTSLLARQSHDIVRFAMGYPVTTSCAWNCWTASRPDFQNPSGHRVAAGSWVRDREGVRARWQGRGSRRTQSCCR